MTTTTYSISRAARELNLIPRRMYAWLEKAGWINTNPGGYGWVSSPEMVAAGVINKEEVVTSGDGATYAFPEITAKGMGMLRDAIKEHLMSQTDLGRQFLETFGAEDQGQECSR